MSYLALYRKYRPDDFKDVVGQDEIINVLKKEILHNKISHAYLFSGPRGTGKTTTAKLIAKLVNCENLNENGDSCGKCESCLNIKNSNDIIEIDAASNNGVDEIRELRDKVNLVPSHNKYKVYIIDEVHMLTTQAFNALLKTLEEPPAHVIFILATTELHKIPLTISSRCQKFQFHKLDSSALVKRLKFISNSENISISDDVLCEIARISDGGARDAINILDQLISYKGNSIELNDVYDISGVVSYQEMYKYERLLLENNVSDLIDYIENINKSGKNISKFISENINFLKDILLFKKANIICDIEEKNMQIKELSDRMSDDLIFNIIYEFNNVLNQITNTSNGDLLLLISSIKIINEINNNSNDDKHFVVSNDSKEDKNSSVKEETITTNKKIMEKDLNEVSDKVTFNHTDESTITENFISKRINNTFASASKKELISLKEQWNKINDYLLDSDYGIYCGILKDSYLLAVGDHYLITTSKFDSIINKINNNIIELEKTLKYIFKQDYYIIAISEDRWTKEKCNYINNINKGIKYTLIEEEDITNIEKTPVDDLIDILGENIIEKI